MPRKKATTPIAEDPETMEQAEGEQQSIEETSSDGGVIEDPTTGEGEDTIPAADADHAEFAAEPGGPFPSPEPEGTIYMPPGTYDPDAQDAGASPDASPEEAPSADAAEGYGDLLAELSEAAPAEEPQPEAAPLLLPQEQAETSVSGTGGEDLSEADRLLLEEDGEAAEPATPARRPAPASAPAPVISTYHRNERVLTINARDDVETEAEREATLWHEIQNSYRTRRILTGTLDTVEQTESGLTLAVVNYNGFRVAIPAKEMLLSNDRRVNGMAYTELMATVARRLYARLGSEIDFIVKGIENRSRSVVASRKDAMYRKRQNFYMDRDASGQPMIYEGRIVQARVVAVAEKVIRVEVFGVECTIRGGGLSRAWYGNANENFSVGDTILVRILTIQRPSVENLTITADVRSVTSEDSASLNKCVVQGHYVGRITDVRSGVFFIRLNNGVNAVAHASYDLRSPAKKDDISFVVTRLDAEHNVAVGIITRIIRQNL